MPEIPFRKSLVEQVHLLVDLARWIPVSALVGIMAGTSSALLLSGLELATRVRERHVWLILLLAPAGWLVGVLYKYYGASVEAGNNLILEQTHDPTATIPARMTPLILIGTFMTHLFGGSAGREGTAIQTGASLADQLSRPFRMTTHDRRILLMAGISAGFGSVFGTPLAGAVFGIEVLALGKLSYEAIAPCFLAAFVGDIVTRAWGIHHTVYPVSGVPAMSVGGISYSMIAGLVFGLVAMIFAKLTHAISDAARRYIASSPLRPVAGGLLVTGAVFAIGPARTTKYLGLGITTIVASFNFQGGALRLRRQDDLYGSNSGHRIQRRRGHSSLLYGLDAGQCALPYHPASRSAAGGHGVCRCLCRCGEYSDRLHIPGRRTIRG